MQFAVCKYLIGYCTVGLLRKNDKKSQMVSSDSVRKNEHSIGVEMPYDFWKAVV